MEPVYEEWGSELVPSTHGEPGIHYRVLWGTVNWRRVPGEMQPALVVLMQYGATVDFIAAKRGEIVFDMPAHILSSDLNAVVAAIHRLQTKFAR